MKGTIEHKHAHENRAGRNASQMEVVAKLVSGNLIFRQLGLSTHSNWLQDLTNNIVIVSSQNTSGFLTPEHYKIYLILQGSVLQYLYTPHAQHPLLLRKLIQNEYFINSDGGCLLDSKRSLSQRRSISYKLLADDNVLLGCVPDEIFQKHFQAAIQEKTLRTINFLSKVSFLASLQPHSFYILATFLEPCTFFKGQKITSNDITSKCIFFIVKGSLQALSAEKSQSSIISPDSYLVLEPGIAFSLDQAIDGIYHLSQGQCTTDCQLYLIDKKILYIICSLFTEKPQKKIKDWVPLIGIAQGMAQHKQKSQNKLMSTNIQQTIENKPKKATKPPICFQKTKRQQKNLKNNSRVPKSQGKGTLKSIFRWSTTSCISLPKSQITSRDYRTSRDQRHRIPAENPILIEAALGESSEYVPYGMSISSFPQKNVHSLRSLSVCTEFPISQYRVQHKTERQNIKPKVKKAAILSISGKDESTLISNYLSKRMSQELLKKSEIIQKRKKEIKGIKVKSLKRLYRPYLNRQQLLYPQEISQELCRKMTNLKENPLLARAEAERKRRQGLGKYKR